jgi:hypothetical protein
MVTVASQRLEPFGTLEPSRSLTWTSSPPPGVGVRVGWPPGVEEGAGVMLELGVLVGRTRGVSVGVRVASGVGVSVGPPGVGVSVGSPVPQVGMVNTPTRVFQLEEELEE